MLLFANATVAVTRVATTPDASGSFNDTVVAPAVRCLVQPGKGRSIQDLRLAPGGQAEEFDWCLIFDAGANVQPSDEISGTFTDGSSVPAMTVRRTYPIVGLLPHVEAYCNETREGGS